MAVVTKQFSIFSIAVSLLAHAELQSRAKAKSFPNLFFLPPAVVLLNGAQVIARPSGLYISIESQHEMYDWEKSSPTPSFSDSLMYSSEVPFFRCDKALLDQPF
jgi:uncharacterized protein (TIGR02452 family)